MTQFMSLMNNNMEFDGFVDHMYKIFIINSTEITFQYELPYIYSLSNALGNTLLILIKSDYGLECDIISNINFNVPSDLLNITSVEIKSDVFQIDTKLVRDILSTNEFKENYDNVCELYSLFMKDDYISVEENNKEDHKPHKTNFDNNKSCLLLGMYVDNNSVTDYLKERLNPNNFVLRYLANNYYYNLDINKAKDEHIGKDVFCVKESHQHKGLAYYFSFGDYIGLSTKTQNDDIWYNTKVLKIIFKNDYKTYHAYPIRLSISRPSFSKYNTLYSKTKINKNKIDTLSDRLKYSSKKLNNNKNISDEEYYLKENYEYLRHSCSVFNTGLKIIKYNKSDTNYQISNIDI